MKGAFPPASNESLQQRRVSLIQNLHNFGGNGVLLHRRRRHLVQQLRDRRRAGERDLLHDRVLAQLLADLGDVFLRRDDVDDAVGEACSAGELFRISKLMLYR